MSFHPTMAYDATFHRSSRTLTVRGEPFTYTAENRARFDIIVARYPPEQRRSAVLPALFLNYFGQGALLMENPGAAENPFYRLVPSWGLYPMVILSTAAAVIARVLNLRGWRLRGRVSAVDRKALGRP